MRKSASFQFLLFFAAGVLSGWLAFKPVGFIATVPLAMVLSAVAVAPQWVGAVPHQQAAACARAVGAGHSFYLVLKGCFPINVLNQVKACPEVARIFCATANPLQLIVARTTQGGGILGVIDGESPKGVETDIDRAERRALLRKFGYKF